MKMRNVVVCVCLVGMSLALQGKMIALKTDCASCLIETKGAHMFSYRVNGEEMLWSPWPLQIEGPEWQHGGMPICWPVYGHDPAGLHGYAWKSEFTVVSKKEDGKKSELVLALEKDGHRLEYTIRIGNGLELEFATKNLSSAPFAFSKAFHPYFLVGERDKCTVSGATPRPLVIDHALDDGFAVEKGANGGRYVIKDPVKGRSIIITSDNSPRVNIWNPGEERDGWRRFVCVEPCISRRAPITLAPGARHVMKMRVEVE